MFPNPSTSIEGYSETTTTGEIPTLDRGTTIAVAVERHVDRDGVTTEVSLSTVSNGVVVNTECVSAAAGRQLIAALSAALGIADGVR